MHVIRHIVCVSLSRHAVCLSMLIAGDDDTDGVAVHHGDICSHRCNVSFDEAGSVSDNSHLFKVREQF